MLLLVKQQKELYSSRNSILTLVYGLRNSVPITLFCDNSEAIAHSKDPRNHKKGKHIERKYHIIGDIIARGDVVVAKIESANNLANPFTKTLPQRTFESHLEGMGVRSVYNSL